MSPSRGRHAAKRRRRQTHRAAPLVALALVLAAGAIGGILLTRHDAPAASEGKAGHVPSTTVAVQTTLAPPVTTTTIDPGTLPQTDALPSSSTPAFAQEMAALWAGVVANSPQEAAEAFFPESAYLALKSIANPSSDYLNRLIVDFDNDLAAAHTVLGANPGSAGLVQVNVPQQYAHWVPPGECDNTVGYFEVANARVVYEENGATRSFGVASMISWRGTWYVIHLGAILRSGDGGIVEDPETGPGTSAPSTTC